MPSAFRALGGDIIPTPVGDIQVQIVAAPDPLEIEYELMQVAANLERLEYPLAASARILRDDTQERFDTETDPDGDAWIPLDEDYLTNKLSLGYPEDILHREGTLEQSATEISRYRVVGDSVFFDPSGLPYYGLIHQTGSGDPQNVGLAARHKFSVSNESGYKEREGGSHTNLGIGRGEALPARPFLGMSEEAEGKIWEVFDLWFNEATEVAINPRTGVVQQRLASGQFGPRIVL